MKHFPNVPNRIKCISEILPTRDTVELLSGKWKVLIILTLLAKGTSRFNELVADIGTITPKMLSKELRDLEQNQLVSRTVKATVPVTVEYQLTAHGHTLEPLIAAMRDWGNTHRARIAGRKGRGRAAKAA
ncbi:MAG: helix-turn-helix transcriptional regulator [Flavobacteriales bacterium]|jgi:DNA-binding HxlR family transcriptional regulator|nr:helix-turn-helix transcriptional regulator [Flavobacteriales bacterium]